MKLAEQVHDLALKIYSDNEEDAVANYTAEAESELTQNAERNFPVVPLIIGILLLVAAAIAVRAYTKRREG